MADLVATSDPSAPGRALIASPMAGNGAGANTLQASLFANGANVGNFTDPKFQWMLTAEGSVSRS